MVASLRTSDGELEGSEMTYYYFCHTLMVAETTLIHYGAMPGTTTILIQHVTSSVLSPPQE